MFFADFVIWLFTLKWSLILRAFYSLFLDLDNDIIIIYGMSRAQANHKACE